MDTLDEADISLIHALQLRPRASWRQLSGALGEGPATLSRRWARLRESGLSWVMAYPSVDGVHGNRLAITEIACAAGRVMPLAQELAAWPMVVTAEIAAREYGVVVTIAGLSQSDLAEILLDRLPRLDGVTGMRTHLVGHFHLGGNQWRIGGLDPRAAAKIADAPCPQLAPRGRLRSIRGRTRTGNWSTRSPMTVGAAPRILRGSPGAPSRPHGANSRSFSVRAP